MQAVKRPVVARGWGEGGMNRWNTGGFKGAEATLHGTVMMDTCHCTFVQTHRMDNTKSDP